MSRPRSGTVPPGRWRPPFIDAIAHLYGEERPAQTRTPPDLQYLGDLTMVRIRFKAGRRWLAAWAHVDNLTAPGGGDPFTRPMFEEVA